MTASLSEDCAGVRLDQALVMTFDNMSRTRIKRLIEDGRVTLNGKTILDPSERVKAGEDVILSLPPPRDPVPKPQDIPLEIAFEDDDLIVVNKPAGMVVHPAAGNYDGTLVNALLAHCGDSLSGIGDVRRPGIVHRIDKDTSGLLVVAKNDAAHASLAAQFEKHTISRAYYALVWGNVVQATGTIEGNIGRSRSDRKKMAVLKSGGKHARTHYRVIERLGPPSEPFATLVDCSLETGRTHQIRVHMAHIGHTLIGDPVYGRGRQGSAKRLGEERSEAVRAFHRQALHARLLGFAHPKTGSTILLEAELPSDFKTLLDALRN